MTKPIVILSPPPLHEPAPPIAQSIQTTLLIQQLKTQTPEQWQQLHRARPDLHVFKWVFQMPELFSQIDPLMRTYYARQDVEAALVLCENTQVQADMDVICIRSLASQYAKNNHDCRPARILLANTVFLERLAARETDALKGWGKSVLEEVIKKNEPLSFGRPPPPSLFFERMDALRAQAIRRATPSMDAKPSAKKDAHPRCSMGGCVIS